MPVFHVTVYLNLSEDNFFGLNPEHALATDHDLQLWVTAADTEAAADAAFAIGNRMATDDRGLRWPADVRSVSVGDLLTVVGQTGTVSCAVASVGFDIVVDPTNPIVALAGTRATSRT
jgi:hypothetical protein